VVQQYLIALDCAVESHPELQDCVVSCVHCGIRFLTHPRNAGRADLRCPFGCRKQHRQQRSCQRSVAYYQTDAGREKKRRLNARRKCRSSSVNSPPPQDSVPSPPLPNEPPPPVALPEKVELCLEGSVLDEPTLTNSPLLPYVRTVVKLIAGVQLAGQQLVALLLQALRQHSIASRRRADYVLNYLHQHPP
jgi:hypothetical protein